MKLTRVRIENYRSVKSLDFQPGMLCALVGENNAGKSNILRALNLILGESWPSGLTESQEAILCAPLATLLAEVRPDLVSRLPDTGKPAGC